MDGSTDGNASVLLVWGFGDEATGGGLYAVSGSEVERIDRLSTTGLAYRPGELVRLLRNFRYTAAPGELLAYDRCGVVRYLRVDGLQDTHGMTFDDDMYMVVSAMQSRIFWLEPDGTVARIWEAPDGPRTWHLNSPIVVQERRYVTAFGWQLHRTVGLGDDPQLGVLYDIDSQQVVLSGFTHPHTPVRLEKSWLVCNSFTQELWEVADGGTVPRRRVRLDGFTRGVAVADETIAVGVSADRHAFRQGQRSHVAILDRESWQVLERIPLPASEIYDVVTVPQEIVRGVVRSPRRVECAVP